jgi:response regulator RpfG family c-di-GMP phosphodiesterase
MTAPAKHCLLVVDDEPYVGESVHDLLRRKFNVLHARSAEEGCRLMRENEVHIVMTDQRMPSITGVELLSRVRVRHPSAIRMLFTGYMDLDAIISAINQGHIFRFLKKPWEPDELEAAVVEAAAEYDRLVEQMDEMVRLKAEVASLRQRVTLLEEEVRRLGGSPMERPHGAS